MQSIDWKKCHLHTLTFDLHTDQQFYNNNLQISLNNKPINSTVNKTNNDCYENSAELRSIYASLTQANTVG